MAIYVECLRMISIIYGPIYAVSHLDIDDNFDRTVSRNVSYVDMNFKWLFDLLSAKM